MENFLIDIAKQKHGVTISKAFANNLVALAKQKYGNNTVDMMDSPEVGQMLRLYAAGTGQPFTA